MIDTARLKEAAEKATPGEWHYCLNALVVGDNSLLIASTARSMADEDDASWPIAIANAQYIVAAQPRTNLALLSARDALQAEAEKVCNSYDSRALGTRDLHAACFDQALNSAVAEVNDARLTSLHASEPKIRLARKSS